MLRRIFMVFCILGSLVSCETLLVNENAAVVYAVRETTPVASNDDAADDPAIWVHPQDVSKSLILGTDKKRGLMVYDLNGTLVQSLEQGRLNNVDLRKGVRIQGELQTLAVATNRTYNNIDIFRIADDGTVTFVMGQPVTFTDPYGICLYMDAEGRAHAFANSTDGEYQQWVLNPEGVLAPQLLGSYRLDSQPEGCTADDMTGILYAGEEEKGIWMMPADILRFGEKTLLDVTGQGQLTADVEGMEIYRGNNSLYLIASSQGDNSYAIYDLDDRNRFVGSVRIADDVSTGVDGAEETDGLTVTSIPLGPDFPAGMLVVQDGYNRLPVESQNFKLVSWQAVMDALNADNAGNVQ